jgi:hypothetical protein
LKLRIGPRFHSIAVGQVRSRGAAAELLAQCGSRAASSGAFRSSPLTFSGPAPTGAERPESWLAAMPSLRMLGLA